MARKRDSQRTRVYRAEWVLRDQLKTRGESKDGLWEWDSLVALAHASWEDYSGGLDLPKLTLNTRRRNWSVYKHGFHEIELAPTMCCPVVMLHELTHASMGTELYRGSIQAHGPEFVRTFLDRIDAKLGFAAGQTYRRGLTANRVRIAR